MLRTVFWLAKWALNPTGAIYGGINTHPEWLHAGTGGFG